MRSRFRRGCATWWSRFRFWYSFAICRSQCWNLPFPRGRFFSLGIQEDQSRQIPVGSVAVDSYWKDCCIDISECFHKKTRKDEMNYLTFNQRMFLVLVVKSWPNALGPMMILLTPMWKISPAFTRILKIFLANRNKETVASLLRSAVTYFLFHSYFGCLI